MNHCPLKCTNLYNNNNYCNYEVGDDNNINIVTIIHIKSNHCALCSHPQKQNATVTY